MTVYKSASSPYWQYDFVCRGVRYTGSSRTTSKRAADKYEAELKRKAAAGELDRVHITLDEAAGTWWQNVKQFQSSADTARYQIRNLIKGLGANVRLADIRYADLDDYVAKRRAKVANGSVNREIEIARALWRYTERREFYVGKPIPWGQLRLTEPRERIRELSADEEVRLFAQLPPDLAAVAEFAMLSGQRRAAIIGLRWSDVDLVNRTATVTLKGADRGRHTFPLTDRLMTIITGRPKVCTQIFTYECARPSPKRGDRPHRRKGERYPMTVQGWQRQWKDALAAADISDFRFHDMRHTALTRITRAVGNLKVTQKLAGHTNIATTARYAHASQDDVRAAMLLAESRNSPPAPLLRIVKN